MSATFQDAAASYFGLAETGVRKTDVFTHEGEMLVVFEVLLTSEDVLGIADRMRAMSEQEAQTEQRPVWSEVLSDQVVRAEYEHMDARTKSQFGSFARYKAWRQDSGAEMAAKVELPAHVYLSPAEATPQQKAMAIGQDEKGNYAVAVEDLTEEQRTKCVPPERMNVTPTADELRSGYVARTVEAMERLSGADGKPTSNADDFGGVPG